MTALNLGLFILWETKLADGVCRQKCVFCLIEIYLCVKI